MAFKTLEEKPRPERIDSAKAPHQELDLQLEKENGDEKEYRGTEQRIAPETTGPQKLKSILKKRPAMPLPVKDEVIIKIEKIMEESLNDSYQRLSPVAKQEFKLKGEQTATQIRELLKGSHIKVKKILRLIFDWLRMLPGVNHFFLEQEAKIKTDRIIALKKKE